MAATAISAANARPAPSTSANSGYCRALNIVPATSIIRRPHRAAKPTTIGRMTNRAIRNQRQRNEHSGYRNPGVQQIDDKECRAAAQRDGVDAVVQIEKVDGTVAKERHKYDPARRRSYSDRTTVFALPLSSEPALGSADRAAQTTLAVVRKGQFGGGAVDVQSRLSYVAPCCASRLDVRVTRSC